MIGSRLQTRMQKLTCRLWKHVHVLDTAQFQHHISIKRDGSLTVKRHIGLVLPKSYNLQLLRADEKGNFLVRHPGLTFCDYDVNGHPQPRIIAHIAYSLARILYIHPLSHNGIPFLDPNALGKESTIYSVATEVKIKTLFYSEKVSKIPLYLSFYPGYMGETSFSLCTDFLNNSKAKLAMVEFRMVIFDKSSKMATLTPLHWIRKYNNVERKPLVVEKLEVPGVTASFKTTASFSEMGVSKTMRGYWYLNHVTNAMHHCVQSREIEGINDDIFKDGIKRIVTRHIKPICEGDVIDVKMWPDQRHKKVLYFEIQSHNQSTCQSCVELY